jgi:hypothetical protein
MSNEEPREYGPAYNDHPRELIQTRGLPANSRAGEFLDVRELVQRLRTPGHQATLLVMGDAQVLINDGVIDLTIGDITVPGLWSAEAITGFRSQDGRSICVGAWREGSLMQIFHVRDGILLQRIDEERMRLSQLSALADADRLRP